MPVTPRPASASSQPPTEAEALTWWPHDNGEVRLARRQTAEVVPDRLPERVPIAVGCYCSIGERW